MAQPRVTRRNTRELIETTVERNDRQHRPGIYQAPPTVMGNSQHRFAILGGWRIGGQTYAGFASLRVQQPPGGAGNVGVTPKYPGRPAAGGPMDGSIHRAVVLPLSQGQVAHASSASFSF